VGAAALRILQFGAGAWGSSWAKVVNRHPRCELVALVDIVRGKGDEIAASVGLPQGRVFGSLFDALAGGVEADAALVVAPPPAHAEIAVDSLRAGLHCLIEKPLAATVTEAARIIEAAEASERIAMVSQNYRFKRAPRTVRRLLAEDAVGRVEHVQIDFHKDPPFEGFRCEMDEPLIIDMAVHHLDQIRGIAGLEPAHLVARSWNPSWSRFRGNACALIELETDDGAHVVYTGSWVSRARGTTWDGAWELQGARGSLRWADNSVEVRYSSPFDTVFMPGALEWDGVMHVELDQLHHEDRAGVLDELVESIEQGRHPETDVRDNLRSLALVLGAVASARDGGRKIELNSFIQGH
jgi:predicted dehydrogenase